jgi:hypothetical protein
MKRNNTTGISYKALILIFLSLAIYGCNRDRNNPGWDYFPDMFYSIAYESYSKNPNFEDGLTMRKPVPGTVPRDFIPFDYTIDSDSRILAGKELLNPLLSSVEVLGRGKKDYAIFCTGCHGEGGNGDGHLYTSHLYPMKPRSLVTGSAISLKDGEIFHTITLGFGSMGAHASQILPEERWAIILYIRTLQKSQ